MSTEASGLEPRIQSDGFTDQFRGVTDRDMVASVVLLRRQVRP